MAFFSALSAMECRLPNYAATLVFEGIHLWSDIRWCGIIVRSLEAQNAGPRRDELRTKLFATSKEDQPNDLLSKHSEPFLNHLRAAGYAARTLRKKRTVAMAFARWLTAHHIAKDDLNEAQVIAFIERPPQRSKTRVRFEMGILRLLLIYLRGEAVVPMLPPKITDLPGDDLAQRYTQYLRRDRGLAEHSILVYTPFIRDFLSAQFARHGRVSPSLFDAIVIRDFLLDRTRSRSGEYSRLLTVALRSFFRFLFFSGEMTVDLSGAIPMVRRWRQSGIPAFLSPEEEERVLSATDRSTPTGRRDHAILLLLARLGLRAGEVAMLELRDIRWRSGEIVIRGKGRVIDHLPLLSDVGEALASYLKMDRGSTTSHRVFVRRIAPRMGLTGPAAVGHIVRRALARARIIRSSRGAAHLFRHGLATRMIRHGASMTEIAEVLRHRSQNTTAIYAKVSFEALRGVALSWPMVRGIR
jgi:site-specific recombinase XerD